MASGASSVNLLPRLQHLSRNYPCTSVSPPDPEGRARVRLSLHLQCPAPGLALSECSGHVFLDHPPSANAYRAFFLCQAQRALRIGDKQKNQATQGSPRSRDDRRESDFHTCSIKWLLTGTSKEMAVPLNSSDRFSSLVAGTGRGRGRGCPVWTIGTSSRCCLMGSKI